MQSLNPRSRQPGRARQLVSSLFIVCGALLMSGGALYYTYVLYAQHQAASFVAQELPREEPNIFVPSAPVPAASASGDAPVHIRIPSIAVDVKVVELGTTYDDKGELIWETPKHAVGHHMGTANPGETGNVVLSGHISSPIRHEGNVFANLPNVKLGDVVEVDTAGGTYSYRVVSRKLVEPHEVSVMDPTRRPTLTLITCYPDLVYSHRLVLAAEPIAFAARRG